MKTAIDILKTATEKVSAHLKRDVTFIHGNTNTVRNYITKLQSAGIVVYPAVIVFTEKMTEKRDRYYYEFTIPKISICTLTEINATEKQRLESNFQHIIYPIVERLQKELQKIHVGYNLVLNRTDIPYFTQEENKNTFHQFVDGCIIKNLTMKVMYESCLKKE